MPNLSENYGLEFLMEDDTVHGFVNCILQEGKDMTGYYGYPYFYKHFGNVEYICRTEKKDDDTLHVVGIDSHCAGACVWHMTCTEIDLTPKDSSKLEKVLLLRNDKNPGGVIPVDVVTADVMPSFMDGDAAVLQMVGLPLDIHYYSDNKAYEADQLEDSHGEKWMIGEGALVPVSFLINHNPENYEEGKEYDNDKYVHFTAIVKELYYGSFELNGKKANTFVRCYIDTEFGPLEMEHTIDQVPEEQRKNIKVGSIVSGVCILSGDAAIYEYEHGAVKDFAHDLMLLRYTFVKGDPERLRCVLKEDSLYVSETSDQTYLGEDDIIEKFKYVQKNSKATYYAHFATVTAVDGDAAYSVGTRCIVLASGQQNQYESIVFLDVDADGMIDRIFITTDGKYHFQVDEPRKEVSEE